MGGMYAEEFFQTNPADLAGPSILDETQLAMVRDAENQDHSDAEASAALCRMVHDEFELYGTSSEQRLSEEEIRLALRVLYVVLERLQINIRLPFSDFSTFRTHWNANEGYGSWQTRRDILNNEFSALHEELARLEDGEITSTLARPITDHPGTGWHNVDAEINELRRHFQSARTEQDYRNIGNDCVAVTERLSAIVYDPAIHLKTGEKEPAVNKTKQRIERFIESAAIGQPNAEVRKVARAVIELAQTIKHRHSPTRRDAGIAADSVIQLANILRRLSEP